MDPKRGGEGRRKKKEERCIRGVVHERARRPASVEVVVMGMFRGGVRAGRCAGHSFSARHILRRLRTTS